MHTTHNNICNIVFPFFPSFHLGLKTITMEIELVQQRKKTKKGKKMKGEGTNGKHEEIIGW